MSAAPRTAAPTETGTTAVLAGLRVALHVTFAALLTVGLARALADRSPDASGPFPATTLVLLTAALAGVYLAGTVLERRRWARGDDVGRGPAVAWLALVLLLWGLLVAHHGDFAWVAFPLFFVVLHVVDRVTRQAWVRHVVGPALVVAMAAVVVAGMAAGAGGVRVPAVIGPLVGAAVAVVLGDGWMHRNNIAKFEYPILIVLAAVGMGMMASSGDLISMYVGIELHSLALYVLAAFHRDDAKASEAGLKYFVLGALSSGLLLYGASLIYGFAGSMRFEDIAVGDTLTPVSIEISYKRICMNAASTWDWFPGHHDPDYARSQGQRTIYLSTLFFHGFIDRGLNEWAGPDALIRRRRISMIRSIYPGQTATLSGKVVAKRDDGGRRLVDLELLVSSEDGPCVPSEATVELADPFVEVPG